MGDYKSSSKRCYISRNEAQVSVPVLGTNRGRLDSAKRDIMYFKVSWVAYINVNHEDGFQ